LVYLQGSVGTERKEKVRRRKKERHINNWHGEREKKRKRFLKNHWEDKQKKTHIERERYGRHRRIHYELCASRGRCG
jgi:hypothetical protein